MSGNTSFVGFGTYLFITIYWNGGRSELIFVDVDACTLDIHFYLSCTLYSKIIFELLLVEANHLIQMTTMLRFVSNHCTNIKNVSEYSCVEICCCFGDCYLSNIETNV